LNDKKRKRRRLGEKLVLQAGQSRGKKKIKTCPGGGGGANRRRDWQKPVEKENLEEKRWKK